MAFEQVHLSKREQWAQNLKDELNGMIPLAEFWALYLDKLDADDIDLMPISIMSAKGTGPVWKIATAKYVKQLNPEEKKDYQSARAVAHRWYKTKKQFDEAEAMLMTQMFLREISDVLSHLDVIGDYF